MVVILDLTGTFSSLFSIDDVDSRLDCLTIINESPIPIIDINLKCKKETLDVCDLLGLPKDKIESKISIYSIRMTNGLLKEFVDKYTTALVPQIVISYDTQKVTTNIDHIIISETSSKIVHKDNVILDVGRTGAFEPILYNLISKRLLSCLSTEIKDARMAYDIGTMLFGMTLITVIYVIIVIMIVMFRLSC